MTGIRNGQPLLVSTLRTAFSTAARTIGVPDLHPHRLRHTAASLAIASDEVATAMDTASAVAQRRMPYERCPVLPQCCPSPI